MSLAGEVAPVSDDATWLATVFDSAPDGIMVAGADGRIVAVNSRIEELFGYGRGDLVGEPIETLLPEDLRAGHRRHRDGFLQHPTTRPMGSGLELLGRRRDGSAFAVDVSLSPVGARSEVIAIVRDVTARRQDEAHLGYLAAIIESSGDAIYSQDRDGLITGWNRAAELLFGYHEDEVVGWRSARLVPEEHWEDHELMLRRVLGGEPLQSFEIHIKRRDGLVVPVSMTLSPIRNRHGQVVGASAIARDITEQTLALSTLAETDRRLAEGESLAHVGGWVLDVATNTVQWSHELYRIHGIEPADFGGTLAAHLAPAHELDRPGLEAAIAAGLGRRQPFEIEYRIVRPDGSQRWLYTRAEPALDHRASVLGLRGISQDITDRRHAEEQFREAFEKEREAVEGLQAADALKDEFLATVSHELRTPLTSIVGFSTLLSAPENTLPVDDIARRIERNANEMVGMVERLLDFSRLQAGRVEMHPEPIALTELISTVLEPFGDRLEGRRLSVLDLPEVTVMADRHATGRVVGNLLLNAIKFTDPDDVIEITGKIDGGAAVVAVRDYGRGLPSDMGDRIFERFVQAPDQPEGRRGAGVGLAIVRRYVELQGGHVWHERPAGAGATFLFTLPLVSAAAS